jgi:hypothetical protein
MTIYINQSREAALIRGRLERRVPSASVDRGGTLGGERLELSQHEVPVTVRNLFVELVHHKAAKLIFEG